MKLGSRLVIGAIAGIAGTMAMTSAMRRLHQRLPEDERYPLTPRELVDSVGQAEEEEARSLTTLSHFAYGAACGAAIAAVNDRPGKTEGAAAGIIVWLGSYMGWIPALRLLKPATAHPARRNLLMITVHLIWGAATAKAIRELADAEASIFAGGKDRDLDPGREADA